MERLNEEQEQILRGEKNEDSIVVKNKDGSLTFTEGMISYENFHEELNHLFVSDKIGSGKT